VTRAFTVRAIFDNSAEHLRPGMLLQLKVETQAANALVIPEAAIIPMNQKQYVYQVVDGQVQRVEVQIGRRQPGLVEILTGLTQGDQVVTQGVVKVRPGSKVTTQTTTQLAGN
jgi:membrane fusion protein (multidrug efflux system)